MIRAGLVLALALAAPAHAETVAIIHAHAFPIASAPVDDATIVLADGHVRSVTAHGAPPPGARVIDAGGHIVTPGLINGATQLGLTEVSAAQGTDDQAVASGPLGAAFDVSTALNANSALIPVARADGVTRAISFPGASASAPFSGLGALIRLRPGADILASPRAAMFAAVGASRVGG